jgi:hypothetical protein
VENLGSRGRTLSQIHGGLEWKDLTIQGHNLLNSICCLDFVKEGLQHVHVL